MLRATQLQRCQRVTYPSANCRIFITSSWIPYDFFRPFSLRLVVEARNEMSLAFERVFASKAAFPLPAQTEETEPRLNISVVFTTVEATLEALRRAGDSGEPPEWPHHSTRAAGGSISTSADEPASTAGLERAPLSRNRE